MDIKNITSDLRMSNFYFSQTKVEREKCISNGEYHVDINKEITEESEHRYIVRVFLTITKKELNVFVEANAEFVFESECYDRDYEQNIVNQNGVAIMFPFIRSQVSLLTTQPDMMPIVLPTINTAKLK